MYLFKKVNNSLRRFLYRLFQPVLPRVYRYNNEDYPYAYRYAYQIMYERKIYPIRDCPPKYQIQQDLMEGECVAVLESTNKDEKIEVVEANDDVRIRRYI